MKTKAIILAAGFGTRMKEYTRETPKPMLPLEDRPMAEYTIKQLVAHGVTDIAMNLHYHADKISNYFGSGEKWGAHITYIYEESPSGTAGGVKKLEHFCQDSDNFIVIYGDIITDLNYSDFIAAHIQHQKIGLICAHERQKSNSVIEFDETMKITRFLERPDETVLKQMATPYWVNSAIYCFRPEILSYIAPNIIQDFPKDVFPKLIAKEELYAHKLKAKRYAIDSEEKYLEAKSNFHHFHFAFNGPKL